MEPERACSTISLPVQNRGISAVTLFQGTSVPVTGPSSSASTSTPSSYQSFVQRAALGENFLRRNFGLPQTLSPSYVDGLYSNNFPPALFGSAILHTSSVSSSAPSTTALVSSNITTFGRPNVIDHVDLTVVSDEDSDETEGRANVPVKTEKIGVVIGKEALQSVDKRTYTETSESPCMKEKLYRPSGKYMDHAFEYDSTIFPIEEFHGLCFCCFRISCESYTPLEWPPRQDVDWVGIYKIIPHFTLRAESTSISNSVGSFRNDDINGPKIHFPSHMAHGRCYCCYSNEQVHLTKLSWPPSGGVSLTKHDAQPSPRTERLKLSKVSEDFITPNLPPASVQNEGTTCQSSNPPASTTSHNNDMLANIFGMSPISNVSREECRIISSDDDLSQNLFTKPHTKVAAVGGNTKVRALHVPCTTQLPFQSDTPSQGEPQFTSTQFAELRPTPKYRTHIISSSNSDESLAAFRSFRVRDSEENDGTNMGGTTRHGKQRSDPEENTEPYLRKPERSTRTDDNFVGPVTTTKNRLRRGKNSSVHRSLDSSISKQITEAVSLASEANEQPPQPKKIRLQAEGNMYLDPHTGNPVKFLCDFCKYSSVRHTNVRRHADKLHGNLNSFKIPKLRSNVFQCWIEGCTFSAECKSDRKMHMIEVHAWCTEE